MKTSTLFYIYDPMCSWCWGYKDTWTNVQNELNNVINIEYKLGGLAPDSDMTMPIDMQEFLQATWNKIENQLGTEFNHDFWKKCTPRRSTYPACRAALIAREFNLEKAMLSAIQKAYYLNALNPSDNEVLIQLAGSIGLDKAHFEQLLISKNINNKLKDEINLIQNMPIQGFPSLVLSHNGKYHGVGINYQDHKVTVEKIKSYLSS